MNRLVKQICKCGIAGFLLINIGFSTQSFAETEGTGLKSELSCPEGTDLVEGKTKDGERLLYCQRNDVLREGPFKSFYKNGKLKREGRFEVVTGTAHYFHSRPVGPWIRWYENGQRWEELIFLGGVLEGKQITYYPNGQIEKMTNFLNGLPNGKEEEFYQSGKRRKEATYKNNALVGTSTEWFENSVIKSEDVRDGKGNPLRLTYFSAPARKTREILYNRDGTSWYYEWDNEGKLISKERAKK